MNMNMNMNMKALTGELDRCLQSLERSSNSSDGPNARAHLWNAVYHLAEGLRVAFVEPHPYAELLDALDVIRDRSATIDRVEGYASPCPVRLIAQDDWNRVLDAMKDLRSR